MSEPIPSPIPGPPTSSPPPRRGFLKRHWWKIGIGLFLALLLLVLLLPTLASTSPVRSLVVSKINDQLNGKLSIDSWSIGWTGGVTVKGIRIVDSAGVQILECRQLTTQQSLIGAARSRFDLGETKVEGLDFLLKIDKDGKSNFEQLAKASTDRTPSESKSEPAPAGKESSSLPDVKVQFVGDIRGTIETEGLPPLFLTDGRINVKVTGINDPIQHDIKLVMNVAGGKPGTVAITGSIDAVDNGQVNLEKLKANPTLTLSEIDLASMAPFLKLAGLDLTVAGRTDGKIVVNADGMNNASIDGNLRVAALSAGGALLNGDTFATTALDVPIKLTRTVVDADTTLIKIESLALRMPEASISITGEASQESLQRLAQQQAPGRAGQLNIKIGVPDFQKIANQLRNTLALVPGVSVTGGSYQQDVNLWMSEDSVVVKTRADLAGVTGTKDG